MLKRELDFIHACAWSACERGSIVLSGGQWTRKILLYPVVLVRSKGTNKGVRVRVVGGDEVVL